MRMWHRQLVICTFSCQNPIVDSILLSSFGMVKKYLRDNCGCISTVNTLKENMPKALASVPLQTIRRWENRMYRWMEAYRSGLGTKDAQMQVCKFSSPTYKSHRRIPDRLLRVHLTKLSITIFGSISQHSVALVPMRQTRPQCMP